MDPERIRIQEDLRGLISGEVRCDDLFLQMYASDASIYQIKPLGVVRPRSTADVVACLQYASENQIPIHARGAGTGVAGESLGRGLVIDFASHMRRILATDDATVRLQPGAVHRTLNEHLASFGRQFGPDPAMSHVTTMGSLIAVNGSGSHWLRYGSTREHIQSLQIVLADGEVLEVGREPIHASHRGNGTSRKQELVYRLAAVLTRHADLIARSRPRSRVNRAGYAIFDALQDNYLDLPHLLCGSEGTLAFITEATLATQPLPAHRGVVLLMFESLEKASRAAIDITPLGPSACDLMDRRHLALARESDVRYELMIPAAAESVLLVEQQGDSPGEVRDFLLQVIDQVRTRHSWAFGHHLALTPEEVDLDWQLARKFVPTLYRLKGSARPLPFVEDVAVPPEELPDFLVRLQNVLKRHQIIASLFGHAGHGQLHIRPFLDLADPDQVQKMERLASDLYAEVISLGGTISGEHALGLSRTPFLAQQYGPLCEVFREIKAVFDPLGILNPGKIVPAQPHALTSSLRPHPAHETSGAAGNGATSTNEPAAPAVELQLAWEPEEFTQTARHCNGCGACRAENNEVRMCPIFHVSHQEEASPRAKANLVRGIMAGQLPLETFEQDEFKALADLCVHCHQCRLECPASVDIPRLMVEAKASYVRTNGLRPSEWFMVHIDRLSHLASRFPRVANWAIRNRQARWLIEKTVGIAQGRKLPPVASRSFMRIAARRRLTRPTRRTGPKVLYFVDTYANYHDVQLAEALVHTFEHNGIAVYVHPDQKSSGMPMIAQGAIDKARALAEHNIRLLAEAVRQGYQIVASEPTAALCLTHEYLQLVDDDEAALVANHTTEACQYLWNLHRQGKLQLDFKPLSATLGYHTPCHLKALGIGTPGENLLRLIPGLSVSRTEAGCSGMAGTYGLKRENYRNSLRAGWGLISALRSAPIQAGTTECSTCKMQMEQGTSKPTIHPLKVLASAYGLMPELGHLLTSPAEELVVS